MLQSFKLILLRKNNFEYIFLTKNVKYDVSKESTILFLLGVTGRHIRISPSNVFARFLARRSGILMQTL